MALFSWNEDYCIGDATVDSQHKYLFSVANELVDSQDKAELTNNAMKLFRYVREHFDYEEAVMRQIEYPAYREHVAMHEELITQLSAISSDIRNDRWSVAELQQFMDRWLTVHIVEEDTKLTEFIKGNGL